jgi:hypothetical protein
MLDVYLPAHQAVEEEFRDGGKKVALLIFFG